MDGTTLDAIIDYGPAILGVATTLLTAVVSAIGWLLKSMFEDQKQRLIAVGTNIENITKDLRTYQEHNHDEHDNMRETMQGLRAELHMAQQKFDHIRVSLLGCETNLKSQQNTIIDHVRELAKVDSKLDAVFRFI